MPRAGFFGLDLTSSESKPSAAAALDEGLVLTYWGFLGSDAQILHTIDRHRPRLVAIDAPLGLPQGLCCLEDHCPCHSSIKGRSAERELARMGIPCYFTTKKSIIKRMVCRAIRLRQELHHRGYEVIEVYPYASKRQLWGKDIPKKTTSQGREFLKEHLARLLPCLSFPEADFSHDLADALVAAYTAYLHAQGRTQSLGQPQEGTIIIPLIDTCFPRG